MSKKYYTYSIVLGVVAFIGVFLVGFFVIKPWYYKGKELSGELKTKKEELSYLENKKSKLEELKEKEEKLLEDAEEVKKALPTSEEVGEMLIQLDQIALLSNGYVNGVTLEESQEAVKSTEGEGVIAGGGIVSAKYYNGSYVFADYFGLKDMIAKAENALRLINFEDFSMQVSQDNKGFSVDVKIKSYVRN